jgi:hypothetical protein
MKIGFASNDWSRSMRDSNAHPVIGGSGYIRVGQYINPLLKRGVDAVIGILAFNEKSKCFGVHTWDNNDHFDCDVIILQRYMHFMAFEHMKAAQASGQIVLNDVDDWYWGLHPKNAAHKVSDPKGNPNENHEWYKKIIEASDGVIVSTPFLADQIREWNDATVLHQNFVTCSNFTQVQHSQKDRIRVGWLGSTSHRSGDLEVLKPYAARISDFADWHHTGHVNAVGVPTFASDAGVAHDKVRTQPFVLPWVMSEGMQFDVGIVPLTDIPFNHAKSYIKGLEYASAGIPFVASWSPQYEELAEQHGVGVVVKKPKDYIRELKAFRDVDRRQSVAKKNLEIVKHKFDIQIGTTHLLQTITTLCEAAGSRELAPVRLR